MRAIHLVQRLLLLRHIAAVALLTSLPACSLFQGLIAPAKPGENDAAAECRDQAIKDTTSVPGIAETESRDRLFKSCMAARGF